MVKRKLPKRDNRGRFKKTPIISNPFDKLKRIFRNPTEKHEDLLKKIKSNRERKKKKTSIIHTVTFDEKGDFGIKEESSKTLVIAASDIVKQEDFANIATKYPKNTRKYDKTKKTEDSLKFRTSSDEIRMSVTHEIANSKIDVYAITYTKDKSKQIPKTGSYIYRGLFRKVINALMKNTEATDLKIIIDTTNELKKDEGCKIIRECAKKNKKRIIECKQVLTKDELLLQTHDFVVGGIGHFEEKNDNQYVEQIKGRIKKWFRIKE